MLRTLSPDFAPVVLDYYTRNHIFLKSWEPTRSKNFYTMSYHKHTLAKEWEQMVQKTLLRFWLFKKEDIQLKHIIGTFAFSNIQRGAFQSCFLGYKMDHQETKKGYMTEALRKGIAIIYDNYHLHRIEANIMPRNTTSIKLVEKLGFKNEGISKKYLKINGIWEDHIHMVKLNPCVD